jgi:hypothetical protein
VHRDIVNAEALKLLRIVSMGEQKHGQGSFRVHVVLKVVRADIDETGEHEIVSVDEELNKEVKRVTQDLESV